MRINEHQHQNFGFGPASASDDPDKSARLILALIPPAERRVACHWPALSLAVWFSKNVREGNTRFAEGIDHAIRHGWLMYNDDDRFVRLLKPGMDEVNRLNL